MMTTTTTTADYDADELMHAPDTSMTVNPYQIHSSNLLFLLAKESINLLLLLMAAIIDLSKKNPKIKGCYITTIGLLIN